MHEASIIYAHNACKIKMKIIFSRKGMDASSGGYASPIFPEQTMLSIPIIGDEASPHKYGDLNFRHQNQPIHTIMNDYTNQLMSWKDVGCHYDPMLFESHKCLALGQADRAEGHLRNQGVGVGDLFLFYGWFRQIGYHNDRWSYVKDAPDIHQIWAYMMIGNKQVIDSDANKLDALTTFPFLSEHPHIRRQKYNSNKESIYVSSQHGILPFSKERCLTDTKRYQGRSTWRLPVIFNQPRAFSHLKIFEPDGDDVVIRYRGFGQEFVLDLDKLGSDEDRQKIVAYIERILETQLFR